MLRRTDNSLHSRKVSHNMIRKSLGCLAAVGVMLTGLAVFSSPATVSAAAEGAVTLTVSSGTGSTNFNMSLPSGAACTGSGSSGYRWETFIVSKAVDVSTLVFLDGPSAVGGSFTSSLTDTAGNVVKQKFPSSSPTGLISGIPQLNFSSLIGSGITTGAYKVGIACANLNSGGTVGRVDAGHYWEKVITVTNASTLAWTVGSAPDAPVLGGTLTADNGSLAGTFTHATSDPSTTGYTVSAVPTSGSTITAPLSAGATSFTITGLTNGTSYTVTVKATNSIGDSAASNSVSATPNPPARAAVTGLTATPVTGGVDLSWSAPSGTAPNSYDVAVTAGGSAITGSPFNTTSTTYSVTSLTAGTLYTFTVTPQHTSPYWATSASTSATPLASQVITSTITVTRPVGALVLTQRCGVHGALPLEAASLGFSQLPLLAASTDQTGTAPTVTGGGSDPGFSNYPVPVNGSGEPDAAYPTNCGLNLGAATFVSTGDAAGQYFAVAGTLDQISVVDTRDTDAGWSLTGSITDFTKGSESFSGNYLGWTPVVTSDSAASLEGYDQTVVAGSRVLPVGASGSGLSSPKVLASAAAGAGLGIAKLDARLRLLIPISANNGVYSATLTFTIV